MHLKCHFFLIYKTKFLEMAMAATAPKSAILAMQSTLDDALDDALDGGLMVHLIVHLMWT